MAAAPGSLGRILVTVKRVVDYSVRVRVRADKKGVETANVKMSMNPFDEIAVVRACKGGWQMCLVKRASVSVHRIAQSWPGRLPLFLLLYSHTATRTHTHSCVRIGTRHLARTPSQPPLSRRCVARTGSPH